MKIETESGEVNVEFPLFAHHKIVNDELDGRCREFYCMLECVPGSAYLKKYSVDFKFSEEYNCEASWIEIEEIEAKEIAEYLDETCDRAKFKEGISRAAKMLKQIIEAMK